MSSFKDLDALKACHELTLAVGLIVRTFEERDPELAGQLWAAALVASSRIARGSGTRNRRMCALCVDRSLGALSEIAYHVEMAHGEELISDKHCRELESMGGRALFYTMKLALSLEADPAAG